MELEHLGINNKNLISTVNTLIDTLKQQQKIMFEQERKIERLEEQVSLLWKEMSKMKEQKRVKGLEEEDYEGMSGSVLGNSEEIFNLAVCHENGQGVEKDMKKAFELYKKSSEMGLTTNRVTRRLAWSFCKCERALQGCEQSSQQVRL